MIAASCPMLHPGNLVFRKLMPAHLPKPITPQQSTSVMESRDRLGARKPHPGAFSVTYRLTASKATADFDRSSASPR
jgi:hypothetical protein